MTTGQKITNCRKEKGLTQEELAKTLGVSRQAVSRWESDLAFPETDKLTKLSKLFGVTVDWLLNYDSSSTPEAESVEQPKAAINFAEYLRNFYFEYTSKKHIGGLPLVHINIGIGRKAKGVISIGFISTGIISLGLISVGVLSLGLLSFGLLALGVFAAGILSAGSIAVAVIALGALTIGIFAMGAINFGIFSVGAISYGYYIAIGDIAHGGIALGNKVADGKIFSAYVSQFSELKEQIYLQFNKIPKFFSLFTGWCRLIFKGVLNGNITLGGG